MVDNQFFLSVLVPTYNYDCTKLVRVLHNQGERLGRPFEIIVGDDASTDKNTMASNRNIRDLKHCVYWESSQNLGRAKMRNRLVEMSVGTHVLIIDCDAEVTSDDFLANYLLELKEGTVLCGSLKNVPVLPSFKLTLRFRYEEAADRHRGALERNKNPYRTLATFNFMMQRDQFLSVRFNENIVKYGYEDTYFAMDLKKRGIPIRHIDNQLIHLGLDTNDVFLKKTETALQVLLTSGEELQNWASVSKLALRLRRWHLSGIFRLLHKMLSKWERKNLLSPHPSLTVFKLYKLGYFLCLGEKMKVF